MSREIKFRAWLTEDYPSESLQESMLCHDELSLDGALDGVKHGNVVLMQYTGRKDKNDTDIYEGDIIHFEANYVPRSIPAGWMNGIIIWQSHEFVIKSMCGEYYYDIEENTDEGPYAWEVIGNIYENPELLKETA